MSYNNRIDDNPKAGKKYKIAKKIKGGLVGELKDTIKNYHPKGRLTSKKEFEKQ